MARLTPNLFLTYNFMEKMHLCYGEMPQYIQNFLKRRIKNHWQHYADKNLDKRTTKEAINELNELFDINNAGIDLDIYPYMNY